MQCHRLEAAFQTILDAILREQDRIAGRRHDLAGKPVDQFPIGGAPEAPENHAAPSQRRPLAALAVAPQALLFLEPEGRHRAAKRKAYHP